MAPEKSSIGENAIELITGDRSPHYEPFGWHHWPEHPWLSYQFRRGLGETQEGGVKTMADAIERFKAFTLDGVLQDMRCPYLILHGGHDVLGMSQVTKVYEYANAHGLDVTLRFVTPEETGAEHCQHDNPTIGQELIGDWLADVFGIDQRAVLARMQSR